jgi:hypothetical protein
MVRPATADDASGGGFAAKRGKKARLIRGARGITPLGT